MAGPAIGHWGFGYAGKARSDTLHAYIHTNVTYIYIYICTYIYIHTCMYVKTENARSQGDRQTARQAGLSDDLLLFLLAFPKLYTLNPKPLNPKPLNSKL